MPTIRNRRPRTAAVLLGGLIAAALAVVPAMVANAHDYLVSSSPAAGSVQTELLSQVSLTFSDRVLDSSGDGSSAAVQVIGAEGRHYETGRPSILDRIVTAPVVLGEAGAYTVQWQVVSADGHPVSGTIPFDYQPPAGATPAPGASEGPVAATTLDVPTTPGASERPGGSAPSATVTAAPSPATVSGGNGQQGDALGIVIVIAAGIVVLAGAGVAVVLVTARRSRRRDAASAHPDDD